MADAGAVPDMVGPDEDEALDQAFADFLATEHGDTSETPEPAAAAETPAAGDRGDGRDAHGRFAAKAQAPADSPDAQSPSGDGAESPASAQPTPDPTPAPEANADAPAGSPPAPAAPPVGEPPAVEPYGVRYGTATHHIAGAVVTPDAIVIPIAQRTELDTLVGRGLKYEAERQQFKAQRAELQQARTLHEAQVQPVLDELGQFFDLARTLHRAPDDATALAASEKLLAYALEFAAREPLLLDRMRLDRERAQLELQRQQYQPDPEEQRQQVEALVHGTLEALVASGQQDPATQALTASDWQAIRRRVEEEPERFFYAVGETPTPEEQAAGAVSGEIVLHGPRWDALVADRLQVRREIAQYAEQHQQALRAAQQAAQENAKRTAAPAVGAAPPKPKPQPARPAAGTHRTTDDDDDFEAETARLMRAALLD